jgi:hypothetical protein
MADPVIKTAEELGDSAVEERAGALRRADGRERFTCCAIDALGIAPMLNEDVEIVTHCHHCKEPLRLAVSPKGPSPDVHDVMVWVTRLSPDDGRACAVL